MQSGDGPDFTLVEAEKPPVHLRDRWRVVEKMAMIPQYAFAGDYTGLFCFIQSRDLFDIPCTVEAIEKAVDEVGKFDGGENVSFCSLKAFVEVQ